MGPKEKRQDVSDIGLKQGELDAVMEPSAPRGSAGLAIMLAMLAAVATLAGVYTAREMFDPIVLWGLGLFAFIGLFGTLGAIAGLIRFGRRSAQSGLAAQILEKFSDASFLADAQGRAIYANQAYRELTKDHSAKRLIGIDKLYASHPEISQHIYRLSQAGQQGEVREEEVRVLAGSSAVGAREDINTWLKIAVYPIEIDAKAGPEKHILWRISDITNERRAQEATFQQLQHIIDYLDHAPAGFFSMDADARVQYVNATLAKWLKIDLTKTTGGVLGLEDIVEPQDARLFQPSGLARGQTITERFEATLKGDDGEPVPVNVILGVTTDDNAAISASRALVMSRAAEGVPLDDEQAERRFVSLFDTAPIAIAQVDREGIIDDANDAFAELFGKRAESGGSLRDLVSNDTVDVLNDALRDAAAGHRSTMPTEVVFVGGADALGLDLAGDTDRQRTGRLFISSISNSPDSKMIVYAFDTTEQKSLELQFAQSQKMQAVGQLAGGVAHDFNNVLTAIIGFSDLLLARHRPTDPSFQDIMNVKQNANRAANLVRQLLAFSRRQTLRPKVLSLSDVLADLGNLLGRLLGEKVSLKTIHGRDLGLVKVDINQFEQVIINLAVNARDAMPDGGELMIKTANISAEDCAALGQNVMPAGEYVLCQVSDTGIGMAKEVLDKIYEPFFSTKEVGKGTGLGLSTVYGIVKQTGGFVFAESEPGAGTTFSIYLPRHHQDEAEEDPSIEEAKPESKADLTGDGTILLVEDEDAVRAFAERALISRGYTVLGAASGVAALELIDDYDGTIDLIISDVVMPEMDGPTLLKELRKRKIETNVIFISGYAEEAFKKNLGEDAKFSFLPKPFSLKQLAATVKQVLSDQ